MARTQDKLSAVGGVGFPRTADYRHVIFLVETVKKQAVSLLSPTQCDVGRIAKPAVSTSKIRPTVFATFSKLGMYPDICGGSACHCSLFRSEGDHHAEDR